MTQENPDVEPPDPDPRGLTYSLNGKGSPKFLFRFAEASAQGKTYLLKIGAVPKEKDKRVIFMYDGQNYTCTSCNTPAEKLPSSRDIREDWIDHTIIQCGSGPYCPHCEVYPKFGRLESVNKRDLESSVRAYEEAERKGISEKL